LSAEIWKAKHVKILRYQSIFQILNLFCWGHFQT